MFLDSRPNLNPQTNMAILDSILTNRRSLLSAFWLLTNLFVVGTIIAGGVTSHRYYNAAKCVCEDNGNEDAQDAYDYYGNDVNQRCDECQEDEKEEDEQNVKTNALVFSASWVLLNLLFVSGFGTLFVTGVGCGSSYRECLSAKVLGKGGQSLRLGIFVGALLWTSFSLIENAVIFGLFNVGRERRGGASADEAEEVLQDAASYAFAVLCMLAALGYAAVAFVVLLFSDDLVNEFTEGTGLAVMGEGDTDPTVGTATAPGTYVAPADSNAATSV